MAPSRPRTPGDLRLLGLLLAVTVLAGLIVAVAAEIGFAGVQAMDEAVLRWLRMPGDPAVPIGPPWLLVAAREVTALGSSTVVLLVISSVAGYLYLERRHGLLSLVLVSTYGGMALSTALKEAFGRPRPSVVPHLVAVSSPSFPSGHSLVSAVAYLTLGALLARATTDRATKAYCIGLAATLTALIGVSRIYVGVHYPTDVLAGWIAGLLWALLCGAVARELQRRHVIRPEADARDPSTGPTRTSAHSAVTKRSSSGHTKAR